ncbi:hypothetical protein ACGF5O_48110 [Streptomyces sp. NPDC048291]|uniref:hypothetical protein n=1 Tax=Streptomyces sp. NPDC048291 TaxID=3365530 RepID=UPI003714132C
MGTRLCALGPVLDAVLLRTTVIDAAAEQLRAAGHEIAGEDAVARPRSSTRTSMFPATTAFPRQRGVTWPDAKPCWGVGMVPTVSSAKSLFAASEVNWR